MHTDVYSRKIKERTACVDVDLVGQVIYIYTLFKRRTTIVVYMAKHTDILFLSFFNP